MFTTGASRATSKYGTRVSSTSPTRNPAISSMAVSVPLAPAPPCLNTCPMPAPESTELRELPEPPTIGDYALLGNCQGSALVSRGGSIDWACLPSFDSPACFARILGEPGGFWAIGPSRAGAEADGAQDADAVERHYVEDTMVLVTRYERAGGAATLTDFMPLHPDDRHNDIGLH